MSGFRPTPGAEFTLDGRWHRVESYDNRRGCLTVFDADGVLTTMAIEDLINHAGLALPEKTAAVPDKVSSLPEDARTVALKRIEHISEAMTGFRSGDSNMPLPGEPRPQYDPATRLQKDRLLTKEHELDNEFAREYGVSMSARTMRRLWPSIRAGQAFAHAAGGAGPRFSNGRRKIHPDVADATERLVADQRYKSSKTIAGLFVELRGRMLDSHDDAWVEENFPSERTWRRYLDDRWTTSEINGKARTRGSATTAPKGGFRRTNPTRPGQLVLMDTNSLDVLLEGTAIEGAVRGSVVLALDAFSWSICALRVVEQAEKNVDVTFTLLDVSRPKQMLPGWPSEARWPFVGIPESVLTATGPTEHDPTTGLVATGDGPGRISAMPIVNPEALVTDHGSTYRAHKTREVCRRHGIDLLPARTYTGSDKAPVERIFGSIRTMLLERLDGYRGSDTSERGKHIDDEVEWTAQRLEDLLSLWAVMVWQTHIMDGFKPAWCPEGRWSPNALYLHGLETSGLAPKVMTTADYFSVLGTSYLKVHSRGVNVRGLWFDDDVLDQYRNQPSNRADNKWAVHYDTRDLRRVWFIDENGVQHDLPWVGITGEFPAFSDRHIKALRNRVGGDLKRIDSAYLAEVLLTQVLPVRDGEGWVVNGERVDANASKHARDLELAAADAAKYAAPPPAPTAEPAKALEDKRRARREAATTATPAATEQRTRVSGGMFGDMAELIPEQDPA